MTIKTDFIYTGDNVEYMRSLPDNCIDLTVTSPPYDGIRTYNGYSFDFENVAKELYRVTKKGGVVVWVVGDSTKNGSESGTSFRQALYLKEVGFNLHDTMIYHKKNAMPQTHRRYEQEFEYMFVLSKGRPNTFNPIMIPCKTAGQSYDYSKRKSASSEKEKGVGRNREEVYVTKEHKQKGNVWSYLIGRNLSTKDKEAFKHPAVFPEQLAEDHILSWSNPGDIVLDPFGGSGTTAKMAKLNGRRFIHVDVSEEYNDIARRRIEKDAI